LKGLEVEMLRKVFPSRNAVVSRRPFSGVRVAMLVALLAGAPAMDAAEPEPQSAAAAGSVRTRAGEAPPLLTAVREGRIQAVAALLESGADPDAGDRLGERPLHAAADGDAVLLRRLLDAGADPDARDAGGVTPLMLAAAAGAGGNVALLEAAGARRDLKDYQGASARDWAERKGHADLARRLGVEEAAAAGPAPRGDPALDFAEDVFVDVAFPSWFKLSFLDLREDLAEARAAGKQGIALFISSARCSYCKAFIDTSLSDPILRDRMQESFDVIGLQIFDDRPLTDFQGRTYPVKEFVSRQRADFSPTLIFYGNGGRTLLRIVGYYPPDQFRSVLDFLQTKSYRRQTLREFLRASRSEAGEADRGIIRDALFPPPPHMLDRSVIRAERPLLVVFERPSCTACERFHRRVLSAKAIRRLIGEFDAEQLDASDEETPIVTPGGRKTRPADWYASLALSYTPALVFFDESGEEVLRLDSETLPYRMEGTLQLVLERAYEDDPQLQRWRRSKAIESIARRHAEE
jgi:thioredoxin-related protein